MIWRTSEGDPFTRIVEVNGSLVSSASEAYRLHCEAEYILDLPTKEARNKMINSIVAKRWKVGSFPDRQVWEAECARLRFKLEAAAMDIWKRRKASAA